MATMRGLLSIGCVIYCSLSFSDHRFNLETFHANNRNFKVVLNGIPYMIRVGRDNEHDLGINRIQEITFYKIGEEIGIAPQLVAADGEEQILISQYIKNFNSLEKMHTPEMMRKVIGALKKLHAYHYEDVKASISTLFMRNDRIISLAKRLHVLSDADNAYLDTLMNIRKTFEDGYYEGATRGICHGDLYYPNVLEDESGNVYFVDWEYAFYGYTIDDLGKLCASNYYTDDEIAFVAREYYQSDDKYYVVSIKKNMFMKLFSMYVWSRIKAFYHPEKKVHYDDLVEEVRGQLANLVW